MHFFRLPLLAATLLQASCLLAASVPVSMDKDMMEVDIPRLHHFYAIHKYTVTQVVEWYLARIEKYNWIYRAIESVNTKEALTTAAEQDKQAHHSSPLWGIPIVIKENTSISGHITSDGWQGFLIPGHELVAPQDAPVIAKLRAAGAIIIGQTNMPDFAASDTNRSSAFGRTGNAYDVRFSPGGSSGGTVTAITANFAVFGTGTDTSNSIRMPSSTSAVIGVLPTRGLVSIAGIAPLDWLLDNTGPIARNVTDAAIALGAMAEKAPATPYTQYLKADSLKGKRFAVPAFILNNKNLRPETRTLFLSAIEAMRAAGATVLIDDAILPDSFPELVRTINTRPYRLEGTQNFLKSFGPASYHSVDEYESSVGSPLPPVLTGASQDSPVEQKTLETDPQAETNYFAPQRAALAAYLETFDRLHLDGLAYPAAQMPPPDETMPQDGRVSSGPHSATGWVNRIGVPSIVVVGGFYPNGLPFGLELSTRPSSDGELLGYAYAYEHSTHFRHPPTLITQGLLH